MGTTNQWRDGLRETRVQHMAEGRTFGNTVPSFFFYGVVQDGNNLAVMGYDAHCRPAGPIVQRFPIGVVGMCDAITLSNVLTDGLR